jgi:ketosteroid isomerase-like protein
VRPSRTLLGLLGACVVLFAQPAPETEVRGLMSSFLTAFNNLDWPAFRKCWVENPVLFHPSVAQNPTGKRIEDAAGFESSWHHQFDLMREGAATRGITSPPFANIQPKDIRVDFVAPTVAVVTFHLESSASSIGRRMFVVVKTADGWKISHLHASNLALTRN